mmetsp:Transcript_48387/g.113682  ORF Transcript_48387/g.113682 Transcript_48387/m.113682 type:complete len:203 (+) Transcript_48387:919-1527(+)
MCGIRAHAPLEVGDSRRNEGASAQKAKITQHDRRSILQQAIVDRLLREAQMQEGEGKNWGQSTAPWSKSRGHTRGREASKGTFGTHKSTANDGWREICVLVKNIDGRQVLGKRLAMHTILIDQMDDVRLNGRSSTREGVEWRGARCTEADELLDLAAQATPGVRLKSARHEGIPAARHRRIESRIPGATRACTLNCTKKRLP